MKKNYSILLLVSCVVGTSCTHKSPQQSSVPDTKPKIENTADRSDPDSLDIILSKEGFVEEYGKAKHYHPLTEEEMYRAKAILTEFVNHGGGDTTRVIRKLSTSTQKIEIEKPLPLRKYFKQYYAYQVGDHVIVHINLASCVATIEGESIGDVLKKHIYIVHDGGKLYGEAVVDLKRRKVISFSLNGEA